MKTTKANESFIFGNKNQFAIEVMPYKIPKKFYLRLWFYDIGYGDFKKGGSLDYIIKDYFKLVTFLNVLYEEKFDRMEDGEILNDILYDVSIERNPDEESKLFNRLQMYCFDFGDTQFNDFSFVVLYKKKENRIKFLIYEMDGETSPKVHSLKIEANYFFSVYKEFMQFAFLNNLKKNHPFFPEGFCEQDIN